MPPASRARKAPASPSTPLPPLKTTAADLAAMPLVALIGRLREMRVPDERIDWPSFFEHAAGVRRDDPTWFAELLLTRLPSEGAGP